jgi:putative NADH-flavin reductase
MKNAETPVVKVVLYGAMSSLGSALMTEMLRRQHEVIAILDDLTALAPRPGLRTKTGDVFDAKRVKQSVAGCSAVICLLDAPGLPMNSEHVEKSIVPGPVEQVLAVDALIDGMQASGIARLFLVGDFEVLDDPEIEDRLQRHAAEEIREALQSSTLHWTLVNAPRGTAGLTLEHFNHMSHISSNLEPSLAEPLERLNRVAVGIADEMQLNLHVGEHVTFVATEAIQR